MKKKTIVLFVFLLILTSIYSKKYAEHNLSPVFFNVIKEFICESDSIFKSSNYKNNVRNVINVDFYKSDISGNCRIRITNSVCYHECCLKGAFEMDSYLIAIYDWRSYCSISFIDSKMFCKRISTRYKNFEDVRLPPHQDRSIIYEIIDPNTLNLVP